DATEALAGALAQGAPVEDWDGLVERRERAFAALARSVASARAGAAADGASLGNAVTRSSLERIVALDAAILEAGREGLVRLRNERVAHAGRRRAALAHGLPSRETPRAITLKA